MFIKGNCAIYINNNLKVYENSTVLFVLWWYLSKILKNHKLFIIIQDCRIDEIESISYVTGTSTKMSSMREGFTGFNFEYSQLTLIICLPHLNPNSQTHYTPKNIFHSFTSRKKMREKYNSIFIHHTLEHSCNLVLPRSLEN